MIKKIKSELDLHTLEVIKKSSASLVVKVIGILMTIGISIFLGRTIGADGLGVINLATRIVTIIISIGLLGFSQVIVKEVAIALNKKNRSHIVNVMYTSYLVNGFLTLALSVLFILISPWLANNIFNEPRLTIPLMLGLSMAIPQVFSRIFGSGLIGYNKIWQSNLVDQALSAFVTGLLLMFFWLFKLKITINVVAVLYVIGRVVVTVSVLFYWNSVNKQNAERKEFIPKRMLKTSLPLFLVSLTLLIINNGDVILLGWLKDSSEIGIYSVAARVALLTSLILQVTSSTLSPKIAAMYASKKIIELEKMIQRVTKGLLLIGVVIFLAFVLLGKWILGLWGNEFKAAYPILLILGIGQLINLGTGAVGIILIMTGYEKIQAKISIIFMIIFLLLNYLLIPNYGALGAGMASAITIAGINITKYYYVTKKTGIHLYKLKT